MSDDFPFHCEKLGFFNKEGMSTRRFYSEDDQYMILISNSHKNDDEFLLDMKRRLTDEEYPFYEGSWMNILGSAVVTNETDLIEWLRGTGFPVDNNMRKYKIIKLTENE